MLHLNLSLNSSYLSFALHIRCCCILFATLSLFSVLARASEPGNVVTTVVVPHLLLESESSSPSPSESLGPLFQIEQMEYAGAFRLDSGSHGGSDTRFSVNYAVGTLAYNPDNHSLFIAGHAQASRVAEFPIPSPGMQQTVSQLPQSEQPRQIFTTILPDSNAQGINRITGMLYYQGSLIVNAEQWYNASGTNTDTTLVVTDADDLAGNINGFYRLNGRANSAGYMGKIPQSLSSLFGGARYFTGWSSVYSIVSRYSYSPSLWSFEPTDLFLADVFTAPNIAAIPHMNFPYSSELRAEFDNADPTTKASPLWNILSRGVFGFFVPGTRTFAVIGSSGGIHSGIGYKIRQSDNNLCGGYCSYEPSDNYNYYWLYDADEIAEAQNITDPKPYSYGKLNLPFDNNGLHKVIGGSFDHASNTLYLALGNAGQVGRFERPPLILTFAFDET